jgi:hypothetical protein
MRLVGSRTVDVVARRQVRAQLSACGLAFELRADWHEDLTDRLADLAAGEMRRGRLR